MDHYPRFSLFLLVCGLSFPIGICGTYSTIIYLLFIKFLLVCWERGKRILAYLSILKCGLHFGENMNSGIGEIFEQGAFPFSLIGNILNMWYNTCFTRLFGGFHEVISIKYLGQIYMLYFYWFHFPLHPFVCQWMELYFFAVEGSFNSILACEQLNI